ncbi:hypothetical protein GUITHDRAFT_114083 [Guillardia theta CCMP2712]|uniref:Uncharacterized protein n=1 Tax=Guillardia theta (strain CCMP2712) TaxID=905079 RepID=L1IVD6_GUITC|nr:hypothetical protein GUITHDRAFT_114083 [Guillardia theta CCMP2712]EKX39834.1 hypothetical protein GUITHDRAFT_114083 [Guillardia theta CCMP2712]|eukprot:XP_005826814.1 hypothetical protein GUITHDRAFT_114083 [Guillardia theta CCMP2712]
MDGGRAWMMANLTLRLKKERRPARHLVGQPPRCAFMDEKPVFKDSLIPHDHDHVLHHRLQILHSPHLQPICKLAMYLGYKSSHIAIKDEDSSQVVAGHKRPQSAQPMSRKIHLDQSSENVSRNQTSSKGQTSLEQTYQLRPKSATSKSRKLVLSPDSPSKSQPSVFSSSSNFPDEASHMKRKRPRLIKSGHFLDLLSRKKSQSSIVMTSTKVLEAEIKQTTTVFQSVEIVVWKNHPFAYIALLHSMLQGKDLTGILRLLVDPYFLCKCIINSGVDSLIAFIGRLQDRVQTEFDNTRGAAKTLSQLKSKLVSVAYTFRLEEIKIFELMQQSSELVSEFEMNLKRSLDEASRFLRLLEASQDELRSLNFKSPEWAAIHDYLMMLDQLGVTSSLSPEENKMVAHHATAMETRFTEDISHEAENHFLLSGISHKSSDSIYVSSRSNAVLCPDLSGKIEDLMRELSLYYNCSFEEQSIKFLAHDYAKVTLPSEQCKISENDQTRPSETLTISRLRRPMWEKATFYLVFHDSSFDQILWLLEREVFPLLQWFLRNHFVELSFVALGPQSEHSQNKTLRDKKSSVKTNDSPSHDSFFVLPIRNGHTFVEREKNFVYVNCSAKIHSGEEQAVLKQMIVPCLLTMVSELYPKIDSSKPIATNVIIGDQSQTMRAKARLFVSWKTLRHTVNQIAKFFQRKGPSALVRLSGSLGVGKSMTMAHVAESIALSSTDKHRVIYYRDAIQHSSVSFLQYLTFCIPECKMSQFHCKRFGQWLQSSDFSLDIIADGVTQEDINTLETIFQFAPDLQRKVRILYTLTAGTTRHQCIHVYPLHFDERMTLIDEMCNRHDLELDKTCKQNLASKKDSRIPLYVEATIKTIALFTKTVSAFHDNLLSRDDVLWHVIDQCPQDLDDLYEYHTIPFLEFKYNKAIVSTVLQFLYFTEKAISFFTLWKMVQEQLSAEHLKDLDSITFYSDLAHFLLDDSDTSDFHIYMKPKSIFRKAVSRRYFRDYILNEMEANNLQKVLNRRDSIDKIIFSLRNAVAEEQGNGIKNVLSFDDVDTNDLESDNKDDLFPFTPETKLYFRIKAKRKESADDAASRKKTLAAHALTVAESHMGGVLCITSWSKNGNNFIATGGNDHNVNVWYFLFKADFLSQSYQSCNFLHNSRLVDLNYFLSKSDSIVPSNFFQRSHVLTSLKGHGRAVTSLVYSSGLLFSGSSDNLIKIWETQKWECIQTLKMHKGMVTTLLHSEQHLFSAGSDGKVFAWRVGEHLPSASWDRTKRAQILCMHIVGDLLYAGLERRWDEAGNPIRIWKMDLTQEVGQLPSKEVQELDKESSKNKTLVSIIQEKIRILSNETYKTHSPIRKGELHQEIQEQQNLKSTLKKKIQHLQSNFNRMNGSLYHTTDVSCIHAPISSSGSKPNLLFTAGSDVILVWDLNNRMCLGSLENEKGKNVFVKCMSSADNVLYVGGGLLPEGGVSQRAGRVTVWNCTSRRYLTSLSTEGVVVALHLVENSLIVGTMAGSVQIFTTDSNSSAFDMHLRKQTRLVEELQIDRSLSYDQKKHEVQQANRICDMLDLIRMFSSDPSVITALLVKLTSLLDEKSLEIDEAIIEALEAPSTVFDHHILASHETLSSPIRLDKFLPIIKRLHGMTQIRTAACLIILERLFTPMSFKELHAHRSHKQEQEHPAALKKLRSKKHDAGDHQRKETMTSLIAEEALQVILHFVRHYPSDVTCMELAMAVLRFSALECPAMTLKTIQGCEEDIFDALELICLEPKFEQHGTSILSDLRVVQRHLELRVNGKVLPMLAGKMTSTSNTVFKYFHPAESSHTRHTEETWKHLLHRI